MHNSEAFHGLQAQYLLADWMSNRILKLIFFWPRCAACGILVPQPGIKPTPPAVEARSLNHWTAREVPGISSLMCPLLSSHYCSHLSGCSLHCLLHLDGWRPQLPRCSGQEPWSCPSHHSSSHILYHHIWLPLP